MFIRIGLNGKRNGGNPLLLFCRQKFGKKIFGGNQKMNPALGNKTFTHAGFAEQTMTVNGVINKSFFLWLILAVGAYLGWSYPAITAPLMIPIIIGTLILSIVTIFKKNNLSTIFQNLCFYYKRFI